MRRILTAHERVAVWYEWIREAECAPGDPTCTDTKGIDAGAVGTNVGMPGDPPFSHVPDTPFPSETDYTTLTGPAKDPWAGSGGPDQYGREAFGDTSTPPGTTMFGPGASGPPTTPDTLIGPAGAGG